MSQTIIATKPPLSLGGLGLMFTLPLDAYFTLLWDDLVFLSSALRAGSWHTLFPALRSVALEVDTAALRTSFMLPGILCMHAHAATVVLQGAGMHGVLFKSGDGCC